MNQKLQFVKFKKEDFHEYQSWYQDEELNKRLGPMEARDEWLEYTLNDQEGCNYSVFQNHKLVAVIGIVYPDKDYPHYCITNIAIKPELRSKGIGKVALNKLLEFHPLKQGESWIAHVDASNPKAKSFFEKNGWVSSDIPDENNNMYLLTHQNSN